MKKTTAAMLLAAPLAMACAAARAGEASDAYVRAARAAYKDDPMCRTTIVHKFIKGTMNDDKTPGEIPWFDVEGIRNVRDIGWTGLRMGRVYRGTEMELVVEKDGNSHGYDLTDAGRRTMTGKMGVKCDFDVRTPRKPKPGETAKSPIGDGVRYVNVPLSPYADIYTYRGQKAYAAALREFTKDETYPAYIHCAGGADRTGTLCFLLETLCGVPPEVAEIDYELTSFSPVGTRTRNREAALPFALMVRTMTTFPGDTFADKVAYWAENVAGLSKDEIAAIRSKLK